jgi:hypothetical protein
MCLFSIAWAVHAFRAFLVTLEETYTPAASMIACAAAGHAAPALTVWTVAASTTQLCAAHPFCGGAVPLHHRSAT